MFGRAVILIRFSHAPGLRVELLGDFSGWRHPLRMEETAPGEYAIRLEAEPGLYRYRFLIEGRDWTSDPYAEAFDRAEGHDNALKIIGGADPPLYFAPDRRHVALHEDGRIEIHAEVEETAPAPRHVLIRTRGGDETLLPIRAALSRAGRRQIHAIGRVPAQLLEGGASLEFEGAPASVFPLPRAPSPLDRPPAWLNGAVLYGIFVDRWRRSPASPPDPRTSPRSARSGRRTFYGGDLPGITESLAELLDLGVTAIVLTPVHRSESPHRYDPTNLLEIDPRLGGRPALEALVAKAHALGLRVIADVAVTHVHVHHAAFQNLIALQERSPFRAWFKVLRFPIEAGNRETYAYYYDHPELPLLDLAAPEARDHAIESARSLVGLGVDGLRLDAMDDAPPSFWRALRSAVRALNPEVLLLGEVVGDRPSRYAEERGIDTATDFDHRQAMIAFFAEGTIGAEEFTARTAFSAHRRGPFDPESRLLFLDNHDTARFLSLAGPARQRLALAYLFFRSETLWISYGTEIDLSCGFEQAIRLDDAWPERLPMPEHAPKTETGALIRTLAAMRRDLLEKKAAAPIAIAARGPLLVLERTFEGGLVRLALNMSEHRALELPPAPRFPSTVLEIGGQSTNPDAALAPLSARVLRVDSGRGAGDNQHPKGAAP